jgi:hypothetical protein
MFFYNILLSFIVIIQCHVFNPNTLNISIGILNARTVIACGLLIDIYSSFDLARIIICSYVVIQEDNVQLTDMNISKHSHFEYKKERELFI